MANFPLFQMAEESIKLRFQDPFASDSINKKSTGIVPAGIYRGYDANPQANFQLFINTDGVENDSVAVVETPTHYNLTVRTEQQLVLDFSGHTTFPVFVVLRGEYSFSAHPFGGSTDAKVVTTAVPQAGDIKICKVNGIGPFDTPVVDTTVGPARDEITGLVTQTQFESRMKIAVAEFPSFGVGSIVRTVVHNFALTNIVPISGSQTLYQTDQGLVCVIPYMTGFGEFSDTSTDWAYLVIGAGALTPTLFNVTQINARQGSMHLNIAVMLYVGVQGVAGGGSPPAPQIFTLPLTPPPIPFGSVLVGNDSLPQVITVFNTGTLPLTVSSIPTAAPFFVTANNVVTPPNPSIPPGGNGLITLKFTPSILGPALGAITINSNDPDDPALVIPLFGVGI
jgi:hypothetical protein